MRGLGTVIDGTDIGCCWQYPKNGLTDIGYRDTVAGVNPVRAARKEKGLTQAALGESCGCGQATVSEIERGEYQPSMALARRFAEVLGKSLDELFGESVTS